MDTRGREGSFLLHGEVTVATSERKPRGKHSDSRDFPLCANAVERAILSERSLKTLGRRAPSKLMTRVRFPSPAPIFQ